MWNLENQEPYWEKSSEYHQDLIIENIFFQAYFSRLGQQFPSSFFFVSSVFYVHSYILIIYVSKSKVYSYIFQCVSWFKIDYNVSNCVVSLGWGVLCQSSVFLLMCSALSTVLSLYMILLYTWLLQVCQLPKVPFK